MTKLTESDECECTVDVETQTDPPTQRFRWDIQDVAPREHLCRFDGVPPLLVQLLWNRGIREADDVVTFLRGASGPVHSPWSMLGVREAVERLLVARERREQVAVYGDYDVDGVTSTVLLTFCLQSLGLDARPFVPRRDVEGYGLNSAALARLHEDGARLVVAVDCGISGSQEVERASEVGLDVIIADHHHVPARLPSAVAVINPKQPGCPYPFKELCAAGIAYKLAQALLERAGSRPEVADQWLDLVALGTVADVVPLLGENRVLVLRGLPLLNPPRRPGLRALARRAGLKETQINARSIAFILAPRLNAAGRLEDAQTSVQLLLTESIDEAETLAETLDSINRERQRLTDDAVTRAREEIIAGDGLPKVLLLAAEGYPSGVVGLVAARLVEEFWRPTLVAEMRDGVTRGSARSIASFHIAEALADCADVLSRHGGHARAAGFTLPSENLGELRRRLQLIADAKIADADVEPCLNVDAPLTLRLHDGSLYQTLQRLEPFGSGNPSPLFVSSKLRVDHARVVGRRPPGHLKLVLHDGRKTWNAIGFSMGDRDIVLHGSVDVVFAVDQNEWNDQTSVQLRLRDLRPSIL